MAAQWFLRDPTRRVKHLGGQVGPARGPLRVASSSHVMRLFFGLAVALGLAGCPAPTEITPDAGTDAPRPRDAGRDAAVVCTSGTHLCGGGCIPDLDNDPSMGCSLGCGEACIAPEHGTPSCTAGGECAFSCVSPFRRVGELCTCTPSTCEMLGFVECGAPDDGCGTTLDCGTCDGGGACVAGHCGCAADGHEENDSRSTATVMPGGDLNDADDPDVPPVTDFSLDDMRDVDWMRWHVVDGFDVGGNPIVTVTLDGVPLGADYDLGVFFACDSGGDAHTCDMGTASGGGCVSAQPGAGVVEIARLTTECSGLDENGFLYVQVSSRTLSVCGNYRVSVSVR